MLINKGTHAYVFQEDKLPKLISVVPGRRAHILVNKELTNIDAHAGGDLHYVKGGSHLSICTKLQHFYFHHGRIWSRGIGRKESAMWGRAT